MYDFVTYLMLMGALSSSGVTPFWAQSNQYGIFPEHNGALAAIQARTDYDPSKDFQWRWGLSLAANASAGDGASAFLDELYASGHWKVFRMDVGMEHREKEFMGASPFLGSLSSTEGHIIESNNARTMPGYKCILDQVSIPFTGKHLRISGAFGDYKTIDDRYVDGALIHRLQGTTYLYFTPRLYLSVGLDHYGIWGGTSPMYGKMPITWDNYFRVCTGHSAGSDGSLSDQLNVIGDQGGAEQVRIGYDGEDRKILIQWDKPYADQSGMTWKNFPDGVWTVHYSTPDKTAWVSDILMEVSYTMWQSGAYHAAETDENGKRIEQSWRNIVGGDNYFNNGEYKSGWTHFGRMIGSPLFFTGRDANGIARIENNRMKYVHAGLSGSLFGVAPYKLVATYGLHYGTYTKPYISPSTWQTHWNWKEKNTIDKPLKQFSCGFQTEYQKEALAFTLGLYWDRGEVLANSLGCTLGLRWRIL